jgi:hypothetical protein
VESHQAMWAGWLIKAVMSLLAPYGCDMCGFAKGLAARPAWEFQGLSHLNRRRLHASGWNRAGRDSTRAKFFISRGEFLKWPLSSPKPARRCSDFMLGHLIRLQDYVS